MRELWSTVGRRALPQPRWLEGAAGRVEGTARVGGGNRQAGALLWFSEGCGVSAQEAQVADRVELQ